MTVQKTGPTAAAIPEPRAGSGWRVWCPDVNLEVLVVNMERNQHAVCGTSESGSVQSTGMGLPFSCIEIV
jgi:hypothetical protein